MKDEIPLTARQWLKVVLRSVNYEVIKDRDSLLMDYQLFVINSYEHWLSHDVVTFPENSKYSKCYCNTEDEYDSDEFCFYS